MLKIYDEIKKLGEPEYAEFQRKLAPGISPETMVGVRLPVLRKLAGKYYKDPECKDFLKELPHSLYDANILHAILLTKIKDYEECMQALEAFLPYIDNWAVCDTIRPKALGKNPEKTLEKAKEWMHSDHVYTVRKAVDILMEYYLEEHFSPDTLLLPVEICKSEKFLEKKTIGSDAIRRSGTADHNYYVNMMIAWYYATALAFQWKDAVRILEENLLDVWCHNKTIQKAIESRRISDEQKEYLRALKRKE